MSLAPTDAGNGNARPYYNKDVDAQANDKEVLRDLDTAHFHWYHVKAVLVSGAGFFTDAYDLFVISLVTPVIGYLYFQRKPYNGKLKHSDTLWISGVALAGTLIGQVTFGILGDKKGRKSVYLMTLLIMIICTVGQALSSNTVRGVGVVVVLCFWRFCLGFGIGGDYPLSATITSEYAGSKIRGAMLAAVFAMQGFGLLASSIVSLIVIKAFEDDIKRDITYLDYVWRLQVGLGAVPAALTIYIRSQLPETPRFTLQVEKDVSTATSNIKAVQASSGDYRDTPGPGAKADVITLKDFMSWVSIPNNAMQLFGTASSWFLLDIAFYAQNLFTPTILSQIGYVPAASIKVPAQIYQRVYKAAAGNAIVALMGTVPGYWFTVFLVDKLGRKRIQFMGFVMMTVLLVVLSAAYKPLLRHSKWGFIVLYSLTFFFANFGPNATTFIIPAEAYPTKFRATCHGISAACGKAGAIVGAFGFGELALRHGNQLTLGLLAVFMFLGIFTTIFVPETMGRSLEDITEDNEGVGFTKTPAGDV